MPVIAALNLAPTTDAPQEFLCRGARNFQITVSTAGVYLAFAYTIPGGIVGGYGIEEFHGLEILVMGDEPIGAIRYRSAVAGKPAIITIIAST